MSEFLTLQVARCVSEAASAAFARRSRGPVRAFQAWLSFLRHRAVDEPGVVFHGIGGTDDHVHLVATVPPTLLISEWVGRLKGASSHYINHEIANRKLLEWQTGYGVVSFGTSHLEWVLDYVRNQREHHRSGAAQQRLERTAPDDDGKPAEAG